MLIAANISKNASSMRPDLMGRIVVDLAAESLDPGKSITVNLIFQSQSASASSQVKQKDLLLMLVRSS